MTHRMSPRRSFVIAFCLAAPLFAAQEKPSWEVNFDQGMADFDAGRFAQAVSPLAASLAQARKFPQPDQRTVKSAHTLAITYQLQGNLTQAESLFLEAKSAVEALGPKGNSLLGYVLDGLGELRLDQGRPMEAEPLLRQAMQACRAAHGETHLCTLTAARHLGVLLTVRGSPAEAEDLLQNVIGILHRDSSLPRDFLAGCLANLATAYMAEGRYEPAEPLLKESLELGNQEGNPAPVLADTLLDLGELYRLENNASRAEPLLNKALHIYEAANDPQQAAALSQLGRVAIDQGKYAVAKQRLHQSLAIYQHLLGSAHVLVARVKAGLAEAFLGERNYTEAKSLIQDALETERKTGGADDSSFARLLMIAGKIEEQDHCASEAAEYYRQALDIYRKSLQSSHPERTQAEQQYARFAKSLRK
ncbi:MAG: tetratricopeptide repeat protein [Acidobacteriia bacterium]|nr:tetratricopeptide repeat protein [Terriglobia bacterium]